jgi:hypothetical protein
MEMAFLGRSISGNIHELVKMLFMEEPLRQELLLLFRSFFYDTSAHVKISTGWNAPFYRSKVYANIYVIAKAFL